VRQQSLIEHNDTIVSPFNCFYSHTEFSIWTETEYINWTKEASRGAVDFYHSLGYLSGLLLITPEMEPTTLLRTAALVNILDGILCLVIAAHSGRRKIPWMIVGLVFGIWALGILFLLPEKKPPNR